MECIYYLHEHSVLTSNQAQQNNIALDSID